MPDHVQPSTPHQSASAEAPNNSAGVAAMLVAMVTLVGSDALVKLVGARMPLGEIVALRGIFILALMLPIAITLGYLRPVSTVTDPRFALRVVGEMIAVSFYFTALMRMSLADVNALIQFAPLATMMALALLFGEPVGRRRWTAALVGLAGVLLIIQPGTRSFTPHAFLILFAVGGIAMRDIATRQMDRSIPPFFIVLVTALAVTLLGFALYPFETWIVPEPDDWWRLALAGTLVILAHYLMVVAVQVGELAVVAPFRFSKVIWGVVFGFLIWGTLPNAPAFAGFALVIGAGLYAFLRERRLERLKRQTR